MNKSENLARQIVMAIAIVAVVLFVIVAVVVVVAFINTPGLNSPEFREYARQQRESAEPVKAAPIKVPELKASELAKKLPEPLASRPHNGFFTVEPEIVCRATPNMLPPPPSVVAIRCGLTGYGDEFRVVSRSWVQLEGAAVKLLDNDIQNATFPASGRYCFKRLVVLEDLSTCRHPGNACDGRLIQKSYIISIFVNFPAAPPIQPSEQICAARRQAGCPGQEHGSRQERWRGPAE